jgi:hypothetical protein
MTITISLTDTNGGGSSKLARTHAIQLSASLESSAGEP